MGKPAGTIYKTPLLLKVDSLVDSTAIIPANRADFKAMEQALTATDLMIKASKMGYLPRLNAFGAYQFNDNNMLGFGASAYIAGVQLSWDIFKGNSTKNKIATQTLERDKIAQQLISQKDQSQVELNKAYRQLADTKVKMEQQQAAIEFADEALRILQNRYGQGLTNTTDVLTAETQLSQQKLNYAQALFSYNATIAYLQFLTTSSK